MRHCRLPDRTGVHDQHGYWRHLATGANATTLPEYFKTHGYETVSVGKVSLTQTIVWDEIFFYT